MATKPGRKISAFNQLHVYGPAQFDQAPTVQGIPLPTLRLFSAVIRTVGDGDDFFVAHFNTFNSDPTLVHESAGIWTLRFNAHTFTNYTVAIIATLDTHPGVTYDFVGDAWLRFRTLSGGSPADNQVNFCRILIIDFA